MASSLDIDPGLPERKAELLHYFRSRAAERLVDIGQQFGRSQHKQRANAINRALNEERERVVALLLQKARREGWANDVILPSVLLVTYAATLVMLECRHGEWPYDYMAFSRRVGEIWEPFCLKCFEYPVRPDVSFYVPPLFEDVKQRLTQEVHGFISRLKIGAAEKQSLLKYYDQVWQLVTSGEVNLSADLHVAVAGVRYVVDFKSGFGSNEKGNMNRLLLVASVYKNIEPEHYECLLLVRSKEEENNSYLKALSTSALWEVHCGPSTYDKLRELSGFDLGAWIAMNATWEADLDAPVLTSFRQANLLRYLAW